MIANTQSGTTIDEIEEGIFRISVPVPEMDFAFNQYLVVDDEPLLFHTGLRHHFPLVSEAIGKVMPVNRLRYVAFSHFESDECGALNQFLAAAPTAVPLCSRVAAMVSVADYADRPPRPMADRETLSLGKRTMEWFDAPHLPHGWETGYLFDQTSRTLFCGDLFTQGGTKNAPLVDSDLIGPSEGFRVGFSQVTGLPDTYGMTRDARQHLDKLASTDPKTLALMHGSAWQGAAGEAAQMLRTLADLVTA